MDLASQSVPAEQQQYSVQCLFKQWAVADLPAVHLICSMLCPTWREFMRSTASNCGDYGLAVL
jgi:hypothetical protein